MPKLPNVVSLGDRPTPKPVGAGTGIRSVGYSTSGAPNMAAEGLALAAAGGQVLAGGEEIYNAQQKWALEIKKEQERIDTTRAEEAFNTLREKQLDYTNGEQNGFLRLKGGQAVNRPVFAEYGNLLDQASKDIEGQLGNDQQKALFKKRAAVSGQQFREDILRHVAKESETYQQQVFASTLDVEVRQASARWTDPNAVALSLERIGATIDQQAERMGWAPEVTQDTKLKAASKVHASVIGQMLATDQFVAAGRYYEANKDFIDTATAKSVQNAVTDGTQKQVAAGYRLAYIGSQNSPRALQELEKEVSKDPRLDDTRRAAILGPIATRMNTLETRAQMQYERRVRQLGRSIDQVNAQTLAGYEATPDQMLPILNAARGTELEGEARRMVGVAQATGQFRGLLPAQQQTVLNEMEQTLRKDPGKVDVELLNKYKGIHERQRTAIKTEPVTFAYQQGLAPAVAVDWTKPDTQAPQISERIALARGMTQRYGAPFKPLQQDELAAITAKLKDAKPEDKLAWFANLRRTTGADAQAYSAIMGQVAPDDPVTAVAGDFAGRGRMQGADLILRGQALLNPPKKDDGSPDKGKLWPMPPDADLRKRFQGEERDAFAGNGPYRNAVYQSTVAAYAALSADKGDASGVINSSRFDEALKIATGGLDRYRGKTVPMPYGTSFSDFRSGLYRRIDAVAESGRLPEGVTASTLRDQPVMAVGDGRYVIRMGENGYAVDRSGNRIEINFNTEPGQLAADRPPSQAELDAASGPPTARTSTRRRTQP